MWLTILICLWTVVAVWRFTVNYKAKKKDIGMIDLVLSIPAFILILIFVGFVAMLVLLIGVGDKR